MWRKTMKNVHVISTHVDNTTICQSTAHPMYLDCNSTRYSRPGGDGNWVGSSLLLVMW